MDHVPVLEPTARRTEQSGGFGSVPPKPSGSDWNARSVKCERGHSPKTYWQTKIDHLVLQKTKFVLASTWRILVFYYIYASIYIVLLHIYIERD